MLYREGRDQNRRGHADTTGHIQALCSRILCLNLGAYQLPTDAAKSEKLMRVPTIRCFPIRTKYIHSCYDIIQARSMSPKISTGAVPVLLAGVAESADKTTERAQTRQQML